MRDCARKRKYFSSCNQMMRKGELFKMVRLTFETQVSEVRKKSEKLTFKSRFGLKMKNSFFFQKKRARSTGGNFFSFNYQTMCQGKFFKMVRITFEKYVSEVQKK